MNVNSSFEIGHNTELVLNFNYLILIIRSSILNATRLNLFR